MDRTPFGDADPSVVALAAPEDTTIVRGMNGCAMASDHV
jgi:hypothetical protein